MRIVTRGAAPQQIPSLPFSRQSRERMMTVLTNALRRVNTLIYLEM